MAYSDIEKSYLDTLAQAQFPDLPPEQPMQPPGTQPGDVLMASADTGGISDANPEGLPMEAQTSKGMSVTEYLRGLGDTGALIAKGMVQGFIGTPGDVESLGRGLYSVLTRPEDQGKLDAFFNGLEQKTILFTTEDMKSLFDRYAPLGQEQMLSQEFQQSDMGRKILETGGEIIAPGGYMKAIKPVAGAVASGAKAVAPYAEKALQALPKDIPVGMGIKPISEFTPGLNVSEGNKIGVESALRVKVPDADLEMPDKPLLMLATNEKNAQKQIDGIDEIFAKFNDPALTQDSWARMLSYAFKSDEVPVPPYAIINAAKSADGLAAPLRKLTQGQIDDASAGFKNAAQFKQLYANGQADVVTTGKLFLWSFLSRGVSPYAQEGLFMDAISGIEPFLKKAATTGFNESDLAEYSSWAATVAGKGSGQPGASAMHNLNAFGRDFLTKMSIPDADGVTGLQKVHRMMADPNMTGRQIRREFVKIGTGVGIDNKVVSFTLLVSGRDDVLVIDRVQLRNLWDDGRFSGINLWDGRKEKRMVKQKDGTEIEKSAQIAGTALSEITYGAKGLLVYEAIERALEQQLKEAYRLVGREADASLGRYHWETWVAASQQEASHGTIDAIMREASGVKDPFKGVTAKQGEYGNYDYGARYGADNSGQYFLYDDSKGQTYKFTVQEFRDMLTDIKDPKNGVVPKKFLVSQSGNAPWFTRPEVNRSKLDELIAARGTPEGSAPAGGQPVPANGAGATTNATRTRRASKGSRAASLTDNAGASVKGAE